MRLYDLAAGVESVIDSGMVIDEETGEILFDADNLEELQMAFEEKLVNCALYIKNLDAEVEAIKNEEKRLNQRRKSAENKALRMRDYVLNCLEIAGKKKIEDARVSIGTRLSKAVKIADDYLIPHEFCTEVHEWKPDKKIIKQALENGQDINGAEIEGKTNLVLK